MFLILPLLTCAIWQINATSTADKQKVTIYLSLNLFVVFRLPFSKAWRRCSLWLSSLCQNTAEHKKRMQAWADSIYCPQLCFGSINLNIFSPPLPIEISSNNYSKCIINSSSKRQDQLSRLHLSQPVSFSVREGQIGPCLPLAMHLAATLQATTPRQQKESEINPLPCTSPARLLPVASRLQDLYHDGKSHNHPSLPFPTRSRSLLFLCSALSLPFCGLHSWNQEFTGHHCNASNQF